MGTVKSLFRHCNSELPNMHVFSATPRNAPAIPVDCSATSMNYWIETMVLRSLRSPYIHDCHLLPQIDYMRCPRTGRPLCNHILSFHDLKVQFDSLMWIHDFPNRLSKTAHHKSRTC